MELTAVLVGSAVYIDSWIAGIERQQPTCQVTIMLESFAYIRRWDRETNIYQLVDQLDYRR